MAVGRSGAGAATGGPTMMETFVWPTTPEVLVNAPAGWRALRPSMKMPRGILTLAVMWPVTPVISMGLLETRLGEPEKRPERTASA